MQLKKYRFFILNVTALVGFGLYQWINRMQFTEYVYVKVPTPGMKMSDYESGCLASLTRVGTINAENRIKIQELQGR